jgi:hypothetical protein
MVKQLIPICHFGQGQSQPSIATWEFSIRTPMVGVGFLPEKSVLVLIHRRFKLPV